MASDEAGVDLVSSSRSDAGIRRFRSRSRMNSSYFAVPARGGASAGKPPAQCGRVSVIPDASLSLMLLHPPSAHAGSATATMMARWRMLVGIGEAPQLLGDGFAWGLAGLRSISPGRI